MNLIVYRKYFLNVISSVWKYLFLAYRIMYFLIFGNGFSCVVSQGKHLAKADKDRLYEDGDLESFPGKVFFFLNSIGNNFK